MPRLMLLPSALALILAMTPLAVAAPAAQDAGEAAATRTVDLIFTNRDYESLPGDVEWRLDRTGPQSPEFTIVNDGRLALSRVTDEKSGQEILELHEIGAGHDRMLGRYPADAGDPALLYFLETVTRNMAMFAHGSPDYIRNRIKDALRDAGTPTEAADQGRVVTLMPFIDDPNAARMGGFDKLTMAFVLSEDPHDPIRSMTAEAPAVGYALSLVEVGQ